MFWSTIFVVNRKNGLAKNKFKKCIFRLLAYILTSFFFYLDHTIAYITIKYLSIVVMTCLMCNSHFKHVML